MAAARLGVNGWPGGHVGGREGEERGRIAQMGTIATELLEAKTG